MSPTTRDVLFKEKIIDEIKKTKMMPKVS